MAIFGCKGGHVDIEGAGLQRDFDSLAALYRRFLLNIAPGERITFNNSADNFEFTDIRLNIDGGNTFCEEIALFHLNDGCRDAVTAPQTLLCDPYGGPVFKFKRMLPAPEAFFFGPDFERHNHSGRKRVAVG